MGTRLNMSQERVLVGKKVNSIQGCTGRSAKEGDSSLLLSTTEATPEVLGPDSGSSAGETRQELEEVQSRS